VIDALLYSVRDSIRAASMSYGVAECEITDDGKPPPKAGNWFAAVHGGKSHSGDANSRNLDELIDFSVTLTGRVMIAMDRIGDQMIARNVALADINNVPLAQRQGFNAKLEQLRAFLHMNWRITVLQGQTPKSANDNLAAWASGTVYGFVEPARSSGVETPTLQGPDWLGADPENDAFALKSELRFINARRFQPQTASVGVFT
jgi:hypothetical protein